MLNTEQKWQHLEKIIFFSYFRVLLNKTDKNESHHN